MVQQSTFAMAHHSLPNYIRSRRKSVCLSQEEIAFLLGFDSSHISRYERFRRSPGFKIAIAFEVIFKTPIHVLFSGDYRKIEKAIRSRAKRLAKRLRRQLQDHETERKLAHLEKIIGEMERR